VPIPDITPLEQRASQLEDTEQKSFLDLIRSMLSWIPEERPRAAQYLRHLWILGRNALEAHAESPDSVTTLSQSFAQRQGFQSHHLRSVKSKSHKYRTYSGRGAHRRLRYPIGSTALNATEAKNMRTRAGFSAGWKRRFGQQPLSGSKSSVGALEAIA